METRPYSFYTADVFADRPFGGNPLAVFPRAEGLTSEQMQRIAREFNLSETTFVLPPETPEGTRRLRIFTPTAELPFAGHPTVGTAYVLAAIGELPCDREESTILFEEGVGPVPVKIRAKDGKPVDSELAAAKTPEFRTLDLSRADWAELLALTPEDLDAPGWEPTAVSCGMPFAIVPLRDREALGRSRLRRDAWERRLAGAWAREVYLLAPGEAPADWRVRMFAPRLGIDEDPATGAAATALGGYLGRHHPQPDGTLVWRVEQGIEMGRPSTLRVAADKANGEVVAIRVGGASVLMSSGELFVPTDEG